MLIEVNIEKYRKFSGSVKGLQEEALSPTRPSTCFKYYTSKKGDAVKIDQVLMVLDSSSVDEQVWCC